MSKQPTDVYERRERHVHVGSSVPLDLEDKEGRLPTRCTLEEIRQWLHEYIDQRVDRVEVKKLADVNRVDFSLLAVDRDYYGEEYTPASIVVNGYRLETDKEYNRRIRAHEARQQRAEQRRAAQEAEERQLLAELKAKYESEE